MSDTTTAIEEIEFYRERKMIARWVSPAFGWQGWVVGFSFATWECESAEHVFTRLRKEIDKGRIDE